MKIAIIGTGITGNSAAWLLHPHHDITVYEKEAQPGGHSRTRTVTLGGHNVSVDTGFIVFNRRNYPLLDGWFKHLGVPVQDSNMSFAFTAEYGALEFSSRSLMGIFPEFASLLEPRRYAMLLDYFRFARYARRFLREQRSLPLGEALLQSGIGDDFYRYFLLPIGAAIWSAPVEQMKQFPARHFFLFFENHGLLDYNGQPTWLTVTGGSRVYVDKAVEAYRSKLRLGCAVASVRREGDQVVVTDKQGGTGRYDAVVMACHADQSLALLANPTAAEREVLGAFRTQPNQVYLHSDPSFMPRRKRCWASWVYYAKANEHGPLTVTYWMNKLQTLPPEVPLFVTLNPETPPDPQYTHDVGTLAHPIYDAASMAAQERVNEIQGKDRIWFCGAWSGYGFHEDGMRSGVAVAKALGATLPWN